eukprot:CAMPEP_0202690496 /NCGR_PEP_ID=MMETSP1385-20130828/5457_1 /ASSEMBLY_ACC=CAM_ASM_000861 /TAXON_ID=933848 /ORGANISM="Elphidium margaritaceum" /LENGTH=357 /DNA_ID=CAMNT_0049345763 /DNA_START=121 /DNA_END=1194 /DNA_ORIENTATION=-
MSQQPPQRIDEGHSPKNESNIPMDVDVNVAYKRKALKHRVECGVMVKIGSEQIEELRFILGVRHCQMYKSAASMSACVVCDEQCIDGEFAVETVLFIPNKSDPAYDHLGRFRIELPRIACHECASEYASMNEIKVAANAQSPQMSLGRVWQKYSNGELKSTAATNHGHIMSLMSQESPPKTASPTPPSAKAKSATQFSMSQVQAQPPPQPPQQHAPQQQQQQQSLAPQKTTMPLSDAERDPFDDGFLICTQLVKTGGADQGGLQVGDVFVEFGHYSKKKFPGLKSIANLVRRSAGKEIPVVVWRKLEQVNGMDDDGTGRTVFQKLALKLKPLQSHDADGGGVLGSVINTYPLPEMQN